MPYLAATELSLRLPANVSIGTNTGPLNLGEVGSIIAEVGAQFDAFVAGAGYVVPVPTGASAYPMVQQIIRDGAGARVLRVLFFGTGSAMLTTAEEWEQAYRDALRAIKDGDLALVGASEDSSEAVRMLPRSYSTSGDAADDLDSGASAYVGRLWEP